MVSARTNSSGLNLLSLRRFHGPGASPSEAHNNDTLVHTEAGAAPTTTSQPLLPEPARHAHSCDRPPLFLRPLEPRRQERPQFCGLLVARCASIGSQRARVPLACRYWRPERTSAAAALAGMRLQRPLALSRFAAHDPSLRRPLTQPAAVVTFKKELRKKLVLLSGPMHTWGAPDGATFHAFIVIVCCCC